MELPAAGWFLLPVIAWVASGVAVVVILRQRGRSRLLLRVAAVFLGLWAVLATTALVWLILNGGWPALKGLVTAPPSVFGPSAVTLWAIGAAGAFLILCAAFLINQLVGRSILRICRPRPLPWPERLRGRAGDTELTLFASRAAEAFSFTLIDRGATGWRRREVVLISDSLWGTLDSEEREAVAAHELAHVQELDSRYLTFVRTLARLVRWDPLLSYLAGRLTHQEEFRADDDAIASTRKPLALARALFKAITLPPAARTTATTGFLGVGGVRGRREALERIRRLVSLADSSPERGTDGP